MAWETGLAAGLTAADPVLKGLGVSLQFLPYTFDVSSITDLGIDPAAAFPITNDVKSSSSPLTTVTTAGSAGTYDDGTKNYVVSSTAGLSAGDILVIAHASLNAGAPGAYIIASIVNGTTLTLVGNPFNTTGNKTNISYQVGWRIGVTAGTTLSSVSSAGGTANYIKERMLDSATNVLEASNIIYFRDAPSDGSLVTLNGTNAGIAQVNGITITPSLNVLPAWTNKGGVSHMQWANHGVSGSNDFRWDDNSQGEKPIAELANALKLTAGDGLKRGRLVLRAASSSATVVNVDLAYLIDSTAPDVRMRYLGA